MMLLAASALIAVALSTSPPPQRRAAGPEIGATAPPFELKLLHSDELFRLSSNFGKSPTVLIFGSYT